MSTQISLDITSKFPSKTENCCQLLFIYKDGRLKGSAKKIDAASGGLLKRLFENNDFTGSAMQILLLHEVPGSVARRLLLVGLGDRKTMTIRRWQKACAAASLQLHKTPSSLALTDSLITAANNMLDTDYMAEVLVREIINSGYRFTQHNRKKPLADPSLQQILLICDRPANAKVEAGALKGKSTALGMAAARDLGNLAANVCTPVYLAEKAVDLAEQHSMVTTEILDEDAMHSLGMGAFLAVSQGSSQPGRLIAMHYQGKKRAGSPVVLVGKGVTFDTGGISIKSSEAMDEMKYDMCGAACVFGVIEALAQQQAKINVIGLVAAAENMPDGDAVRPGDVVTSMSGQTIEILNTDAEGRLVLCDALTYAARFKPVAVIDIATLTGAAVVALGKTTSAVMGNDQNTIDALIVAGIKSGDPAWQLPINDDYQSQLDSNFADIANIGGRAAGAITAACFLARFAQDFKWAHLDIAGVAWTSGKEKGSTGRPVPLLMQYLNNIISK